ncbi:hypothetical protein BDN72DRAFT_865603 [Pluteus cervinus]|uniref:Uncharacterized protein n=1 Tax=Pluteus cervinus TaxID=181527 RepID=A0ACD3A0D6_9AGAR|nr:hypothetical protein BDN72DRAFT_865603 [Pluteus cervinus]
MTETSGKGKHEDGLRARLNLSLMGERKANRCSFRANGSATPGEGFSLCCRFVSPIVATVHAIVNPSWSSSTFSRTVSSTKESGHNLTFAAIWDPEEGMTSYHGEHLLCTPVAPSFSPEAAGPLDDSTIDHAAPPYSISCFNRQLRPDERQFLSSLDLPGLDSVRHSQDDFVLLSPVDTSDSDSESDDTCNYTPVLERPSNIPWAKPNHTDHFNRPSHSNHLDLPNRPTHPVTPSSTLTFAAVWDPEEGMTAFSGPALFDSLCPTPQKVTLHTPCTAHTAKKYPGSSSLPIKSISTSGYGSGSRPSLGNSSTTSFSANSCCTYPPPLPPKQNQTSTLGRSRASSLNSKPLPPPPPPRSTTRPRPSAERIRPLAVPKKPHRRTTLVLTEQDIEDLTTLGVADLECEIGLLLSQPPINTWYREEEEGASNGGCSGSGQPSGQVDQFDPLDRRYDPHGNSRFSIDTFICDAGHSQDPCHMAVPDGEVAKDVGHESVFDEGFYEAIAEVYGHPDCEPHLPSRFSMTTTSTTNYLQVDVSSETSSINPTHIISRRFARVPPASAFHQGSSHSHTHANTDPSSHSGHPSHLRSSRSDEGETSGGIRGSTNVPRGLRRRATTLNRLSKALGKWTRVAKHEEQWVWVEVRPVIRERLLLV